MARRGGGALGLTWLIPRPETPLLLSCSDSFH